MSCWQTGNSEQQGPRSLHTGGINTCFADGSVHFISDFVQLGTNTNNPANLGVWDKLNLSNDGLPIDASASDWVAKAESIVRPRGRPLLRESVGQIFAKI